MARLPDAPFIDQVFRLTNPRILLDFAYCSHTAVCSTIAYRRLWPQGPFLRWSRQEKPRLCGTCWTQGKKWKELGIINDEIAPLEWEFHTLQLLNERKSWTWWTNWRNSGSLETIISGSQSLPLSTRYHSSQLRWRSVWKQTKTSCLPLIFLYQQNEKRDFKSVRAHDMNVPGRVGGREEYGTERGISDQAGLLHENGKKWYGKRGRHRTSLPTSSSPGPLLNIRWTPSLNTRLFSWKLH